jgi:hypothetical protein
MSKKLVGPLTRGLGKRPVAAPKNWRPITLWVVVRRSERRLADRLAVARGFPGLEEMLAQIVGELAAQARRPSAKSPR